MDHVYCAASAFGVAFDCEQRPLVDELLDIHVKVRQLGGKNTVWLIHMWYAWLWCGQWMKFIIS